MDVMAFIALFLFILITTFGYGFFSLPGFIVVSLLYVILLFLFFARRQLNQDRKKNNSKTDTTGLLRYVFISVFSLFLFYSSGIYQSERIIVLFMFSILAILYPFAVSYACDHYSVFWSAFVKYRFLVLLIGAFLLRLLMLKSSPAPVIDVYTMLRQAPQAILHGQNPYQYTFSPVYPGIASNYFNYFPGAFLLEVPFTLFFPDPRILLLLADMACGWLIFKVGKGSVTSQLFCLTYLFRPNSLFILEQSWLSSLHLMFIFLAFISVLRKMKYYREISGVLTGLLISIQPQNIILVPFFLFLTRSWRTLVFAVVTSLGIIAPFFFWSQKDFLYDTVYFFFRPSDQMAPVPIHQSLNINTFLYIFTGRDAPFIFLAICMIVLMLIILIVAYRNSVSYKSYSIPLLGMIVSYFTFFYFWRFSFINYYYFLTGLYIFWLTVVSAQDEKL